MDAIDIQPVTRPFRKTVRIPGEQEHYESGVAAGGAGGGETHLTGVLFADDTWQMMSALQMLGYELRMDQAARTVSIVGRGKFIPASAGEAVTLACGNSGTTIRFLTAMLTLAIGEYVLDGVARMRQRPIDQLVDQLKVLGADISYDVRAGYPPIRLQSRGLAGGGCQFSDAKSSQYISAVLLAAPLAASPVTVSLLGPVTSEPYVVMTLRMMEQFGVSVQMHDQCGQKASRPIAVPTGSYRPQPTEAGGYAIEPDASNASYFLAAAAIVPESSITVEGLGKKSLQGDMAFAEVLHQMGANRTFTDNSVAISMPPNGKLHGIDIDMNHIPDMVQTLAVVALFANGQTTIRNVWNLRVKETDRLAALETELRKLGADVQTGRDWIAITPPPGGAITPASIKTYDDHRMAMSFSVAGLKARGVRIEEPGCVGKTYPGFFEDLRAAFS